VNTPHSSSGGHDLAWFVAGCLAGISATVAALGIWLLADEELAGRVLDESASASAALSPEQTATNAALEALAASASSAHAEPAQPAPVAHKRPADCPELPEVETPWSPSAAAEAAMPPPITAPSGLERRVRFWEAAWGKHPDQTWLIIDSRRPWVVHTTVDCRPIYSAGGEDAEARCRTAVGQAKSRVIGRLRKARRRPGRKTLQLYDGNRGFARSAYRAVMLLEGHKDSLDEALKRAAPYLSTIERIFAGMELPTSLARLSIVESLFELDVVSSAGAVGVFQFMPATARQYIKVRGDIDERLDPLRSSYAAARYLKELNGMFKSWPLALTAYNTGPGRMQKLIGKRRSRDIVRLAEGGSYGAYGFDGQNYFAQFIAVERLTASRRPTQAAITGVAVQIKSALLFAKLAACLGAEPATLARENRALSEAVVKGERDVPAGYVATVPAEGASLPSSAEDA